MATFMRSMSRDILRLGQSSFSGKGNNNTAINPKRYIRGLRRKPLKIIYPDGREESRIKATTPVPETPAQHSHKKSSRVIPESNTKTQPQFKQTQVSSAPPRLKDETQFLSTIEDVRFERAHPDDKRLSKLVTIARSRAYRENRGKILLEGKRLICDALAAGARPQTLFFSSIERLNELPMDKLQRASLVKVKFEEIKKWSDVIAPQGVIGIFSRPEVHKLDFPKDQRGQTVPLSLVCDNIRDPGNLGTIIRCAAAAGCESVLLSKGCVDIWEPKVLRAAMGAHFRLPLYPNLSWKEVPNHLPRGVTVHTADHFGFRDRELESPAKCVQKPSDMGWVSGRREKQEVHRQDYIESDSEDEWESSGDEEDMRTLPQVEPKLYYDTWAQGSTALVIGGETSGLSVESLQLAEQTDGRRLYVPLALGVESLNSAMAATILLFEGRRQLVKYLERSGRRVRN